jgi:hypothetical protein
LSGGQSRVALAAVAIAEGRFAEAESRAREALARFEARGAVDQQAFALGVLCRALLEGARSVEAGPSCEAALALASKGENPHARAAVAASVARWHAATGRRAAALELLQRATREARALSLASAGAELERARGALERPLYT